MFKSVNRFASQQPVIFWSLILGSIGPAMALTVPDIRRKYFGFKGYEPLPVTYPLPNRARVPTTGYEDA